MSAFGGTADRARLLLARPNKIRYFLQSIFPANRAGKIMGRPVRDDFGSGRFGVDKTAQRRARGRVRSLRCQYRGSGRAVSRR